MTYAEAAIKVLEEAGKPLHYKEITERALSNGYYSSTGETPDQSMYTAIAYQMGRGEMSVFVKVAPGVFGLRKWKEQNSDVALAAEETEFKVRVPHFPAYEEARRFLVVLEGRRPADFTSLKSAISDLHGTPQSPMDWTNPDEWIEERLSGSHQELARAIWEGTERTVNPRHARGHWLLSQHYGLLEKSSAGLLRITAAGKDFLDDATGETVALLDENEGLLELLSQIAALGPGTKSTFLEAWAEFCRKVSKFRSTSTIESALYQRLNNLVARDYVDRSGYTYSITDPGLAYLGDTEERGGMEDGDTIQDIRELNSLARKRVREGLRELLEDMDPYDFEELVRRLLQKMGYTDLEVTSKGNDKGVDVLGDIELGITSVREVIQVKRNTKSNIHRPTLDQLRGSLHRFDAVRGTIITTSDFSSGTRTAAFEKGAAPITLINGEKLIDLLVEHRLGVRSEKVEVLRLEPEDFAVEFEQEEMGE